MSILLGKKRNSQSESNSEDDTKVCYLCGLINNVVIITCLNDFFEYLKKEDLYSLKVKEMELYFSSYRMHRGYMICKKCICDILMKESTEAKQELIKVLELSEKENKIVIDLNNKGVRVEKTDKKIRFCIENKKNVIQIPNSIKEEAIKNRKEKINKFIMDLDYQIMNLRYINCLQKNSVPLIYSYLWLYKDLVNQQIYRNETYRAYLDN